MKLQHDVNSILESLEVKHQRCTYNAMVSYLGISLPRLFSALGVRRPRASWIVNQGTLKPTKYTRTQEHDHLYDSVHVILQDKELTSFLSGVERAGDPLGGRTEHACYGVDGCKGGWLFAKLLADDFSFGTVPTIDKLLDKVGDKSPIFIDIPIGLQETTPEARMCDKEARQALKPHRTSSVFNAPIRDILNVVTYDSANALSKKLIAKGISQQSFNIMAKIREVDTLLHENPRAKQVIREVHPEVCFWALANRHAMKNSKKTEAGFNDRLKLIEQYCPSAPRSIFAAIDHYPRSIVAKDDILDAAVAAITASYSDRWATLPVNPENDSHGLPMEMVYLK